MKITLEELKTPVACDDVREFLSQSLAEMGLKEFPAHPEGWTKIHQAVMLSHPVMRQWWGDAVAKGVIPAWSMAKAQLAQINLVGADLGGANLDGANLTRAYLGGAYLWAADLRGADLTRANLGGANLDRAYLWAADLGEANLTRANLGGANLEGANLTRADLTGAYLGGANLDRANRYTDDPEIPGWEVVNGRLRKKKETP